MAWAYEVAVDVVMILHGQGLANLFKVPVVGTQGTWASVEALLMLLEAAASGTCPVLV